MQPWQPNLLQKSARTLKRELIIPYSTLLSADLIESPSDYHVHADLPGVEDLNIEIVANQLIIKAERKIVHDESSHTAHSMERSYGKILRKLMIPPNADKEKGKWQ